MRIQNKIYLLFISIIIVTQLTNQSHSFPFFFSSRKISRMSSSLPKPKETSLISSTATNQPKDEDDDKTTPPLLKDKLFSAIESTHQDTEMKGFGRFLDAGTGSHSLKW